MIIPELGASLVVDNSDEESDDVTVNSTKFIEVDCDRKSSTKQISELKEENHRLVQDLLESHKLYQALLKSTISDHRLCIDLLKCSSVHSNSDNTSPVTSTDMKLSNHLSEVKAQCGADAINNNIVLDSQPKKSTKQNNLNTSSKCELMSDNYDRALAEWLNNQNVDSKSKNIILTEEFTFDDFIYETDKEDIRRLGLRYASKSDRSISDTKRIIIKFFSLCSGVVWKYPCGSQ